MKKDNNITNINEYRANMMPDASGFNINNSSQNMQVGGYEGYAAEGDVAEFLSEEFVNAYLEATNQNTPDLWSRVEAGFEKEAADVISQNKRRTARAWKTVGFVAAAVLITVIVVPIMSLNIGGKKSEEPMYFTEAYHDEASDSIAMEAPVDEQAVAMEGEQNESVKDNAAKAEGEAGSLADDSEIANEQGLYSNSVSAEATEQLKEIEGVQTDERQLVVVGEFSYDGAAGSISFEIKEIKSNQYNEFIFNAGDKITLSNPVFVRAMDTMLIEEEIILDSVEIDETGNIIGRIIQLIHQW